MRRGILAFVFTFVVGVSGIATAAVFSGSASPGAGPPAGHPSTEANDSDNGVHGGPIDRFQRAGSCDLTAVSPLKGNWTHGDYVSAVAAKGTPDEIREAAQSDCGKPMVAVGHGGGPPEHALEHMAAGKGHAGGAKDDDADSDSSGS